jgi:transposase
MFLRVKKVGKQSYLQIVQNTREGKSVRQRVVATLGNTDDFIASGKLDALASSILKHTTALRAFDACREGSLQAHRTRSLGPALVFERLWKDLGIPSVLEKVLAGSRFTFSVERAVFLTVMHRLFCSGSDRAAEKWKDDFRIDGVGDIALHQLYRAMNWLGQTTMQMGSDNFSHRCRKDLIEEELFLRKQDLFSELELVFFDTTSLYFEGEGGQDIGRHGHSKDNRPDLKQMVVGAILDRDGRPICCEMWPGNVTDVTTLLPVVQRLKERFRINSICIVADRGMVSRDTIEKLESDALKMNYILGVRMRSVATFREEAFTVGNDFIEVTPPRKSTKDPSPLKVSDRMIDGRRYVICFNEEQARKDAHDRAAIIESLRDKLTESDKNLVGNKGYRKYLLNSGGNHFAIDEEKIQGEAKYDGIWVLTTNMDLGAPEIALHYKELWMVEDVFRSVKTVLTTRPIYHQLDGTIRGHVFCSFLALMLLKELESRLDRRGVRFEWEDIKRDLVALEEVEVEFEGKTLYLRTDLRGSCNEVLKAAGVAIPPTVLPTQE